MMVISNEKNPIPTGWICPVCKNVYAPFMPQCTICGAAKPKVEAAKRPAKTLIAE